MVLGKQAACLRTVGDRHPDPRVAALEPELKELGNGIGMGAMGFVGSSMVVDCHIEVGYTHTGGMPMSVHTFCLSSRRATARVGADGTIEPRADPRWFTPYMRRETVEWMDEAQHSRKSVWAPGRDEGGRGEEAGRCSCDQSSRLRRLARTGIIRRRSRRK